MNILKWIPRNKPRTGLSQMDVLSRVDEDVRSMIGRNRFMGDALEIGPNWVHAVIGRGPSGEFGKPGTFEDLGWARNLKTTVGMDWLHCAMGGNLPLGTQTISSTPTATTYPTAGTPYTASQLIGMRIVCPVTNIGTSPVIGNILSNTTAAITVDAWWTQGDTTGTTPAAATMGIILPGAAPARFMALTDNTSGPAVGDTALTGEYVAQSMNRALALYAHTPGATTYTQYKLWTCTSGPTGTIHKAGLFTGGYGTAGGGVDVANTNLNADAVLATSDTLAVTWTWTLPAAG